MDCRICDIIKKRGLTFFVGFVFAICCFLVINAAMKPVSTPEYCGSECHEMTTAYQSWELSTHGANKSGVQVDCSSCHLPPKDEGFFTHLLAKGLNGGRDIFVHYFGGEYDVEKTRIHVLEHMPNQRCMHCHNSLLKKPANSAARLAHIEVLNQPEGSEIKCIECHEDVGHQRKSKLFTL